MLRADRLVMLAGNGGWPNWDGGVVIAAATTSSRNIVVVFPFIGCDHGLHVMGCPLYVLPYRAPRACAFVITPAKSIKR